VINRTLAHRYFTDADPIGSALRLPHIEDRPPVVLSAPKAAESWLTILGVVEDAKNDGLKNPVKPAVYLPSTWSMGQYTQVLVRSTVPPLRLVNPIRKQLAKLNPDQQTYDPQKLETWISEQPEWQQEHLAAWIFDIFAVLALALAAVGLYSVVAYTVAQRTGEFGIRMALGAQRRDVLRAVLASNLTNVAIGIVTGVFLALALSRLIERWAGGNSRDPVSLLLAITLLVVVSAFACIIPAQHATELDPVTALRFE
jgi:ABC-type antimicrobial peptide transport system permease subunit